MKNILIMMVILCVCYVPVMAQDNGDKEISALVERLRLAMLNGNEKELNALTASELSYGHSSGKVEDQKTFVSRLVKGESDFSVIDISDVSIKVVGNTAIVRHKLTGEVVDSGQASKPNISVLLVWQKQKGEWKLLARQAVKNP